jgi:hypothetical protein
MSTPDARRPYVVGAVKIPYADRDVAHQVITAADDRDFFNVIGADDDPKVGHTLPTGRNVTYRVELTDDEADLFRSASNCRYVELDTVEQVHAGPITTPAASSMRFMRADFGRIDQFHGRDVTVGIIDGGVSPAVRNYLGATLVARKVTATSPVDANGVTIPHGCEVAACIIPPGGRYVDAVTTDVDGNIASVAAAAARWCTDQGAKVVNYSSGGSSPVSAWEDAIVYMRDRGVQFFASAGNDNVGTLDYPSAYCTSYANVHSIIAFDEQTGARSTFSSATRRPRPGAPPALKCSGSPRTAPPKPGTARRRVRRTRRSCAPAGPPAAGSPPPRSGRIESELPRHRAARRRAGRRRLQPRGGAHRVGRVREPAGAGVPAEPVDEPVGGNRHQRLPDRVDRVRGDGDGVGAGVHAPHPVRGPIPVDEHHRVGDGVDHRPRHRNQLPAGPRDRRAALRVFHAFPACGGGGVVAVGAAVGEQRRHQPRHGDRRQAAVVRHGVGPLPVRGDRPGRGGPRRFGYPRVGVHRHRCPVVAA